MSETTIGSSPAWVDPGWRRAIRTPLVIGLGVALAVQLLLALLLGGGADMAPAAADAPLIPADADQVTAIEIRAGEGGDRVVLTRVDDGWVLADLDGFPASVTRVDELLDSLFGLRRPLPVATSETADRRFKVADDHFERRLTLRAGDDEIGTLIVGDSPGFRRLFARLDGEDAIYDLRLALFDLSASADDWIDRGRLQVDRDRIRRVAGADWALINGDDGWRLEGRDEVPDTDAVDGLLSSISSLGYRAVLGTVEKPEYGLAAPAVTLDIDLDGGDRRAYRIAPLADESDFVLKRADDPFYYRLARFDVEGLLDLTIDRLLGVESKAEADGANDAASNDEPQADPLKSGEVPSAPVAEPSQPVEAASGSQAESLQPAAAETVPDPSE